MIRVYINKCDIDKNKIDKIPTKKMDMTSH